MINKKFDTITNFYGDIFFLLIFSGAIFGAIMIFSVTAQRTSLQYHFFKQQLIAIFIGTILCIIITKINPEWLKKIVVPLLVVNFVLLIAVFFFREIKGAHRWITLPGGWKFQPSELAKLTTIMFIAKYIDQYRSRVISLKKEFWILLGIIFLFTLLILFQPDLGIPVIILSVSGILLIFSGVRGKHLLKIGLFILIFCILGIILFPYRIVRISTFLNPWKYKTKEGYQLTQSFLSLSYGHLLGRGLGSSKFKEFYLPEAHTDFIFSVIGEELGFVGTTSVVLWYTLLFFIGIKIVEQVMTKYGFYGGVLVYGIVLTIVLQGYINMLVVTGLLPTKGVGLPFISYGGSGIITNFLGVGIILNLWYKSFVRKKI